MKQQLSACLVISVLVLAIPAKGQDYEWNVSEGDSFIYWLEGLSSSLFPGNQNLAALMTDANRTTIIGFTNITENYVEYFQTTGIKVNTTTKAEDIISIGERINQTLSYTISTQNIAGQILVLPNGSFPYVLPQSTPDYSNYFNYIEAIAGTAGGLITTFLGTTLNITETPVSVETEIDSELLKLNAQANVGSLNLTGLLNGTGFEIPEGVFENITVGINIDYNLTDGGMSGLSLLFNSTLPITNTTQSIELFFNLTRMKVLRFKGSNLSSDSLLFFFTIFGGVAILAIPILWTMSRSMKKNS